MDTNQNNPHWGQEQGDPEMTPLKSPLHLLFIVGLMVLLYFTVRWTNGGQP